MRNKKQEIFTRSFPYEIWKEIKLEFKSRNRYSISNYGRLVSFKDKLEDGFLLKGGTTVGYRIFGYTYYIGKKRKTVQIPFRKLVAQYFLPPPQIDQIYVINIDYNKQNDFVDNLKWVTKKEFLKHTEKSPKTIAFRIKNAENVKNRDGKKLTASRVKILKKKIFDPNRKTRMIILARQFGISEKQIYRVKTGENWGQVTID
jgi:hypothetical protein